jgi:NADPH2:quinone reductase
MHAVVMTATGSPEVLEWQSVPLPQIQHPDEVLVRLQAAGVNPIDTKLRQRGTFYPDQMPAILGCDGAGIVEAVGTGVSRCQVGDAVYFCQGGLGAGPGTYAEYAVVPQDYLAAKPKRLSFVEAAAAPLVLITAWEALYDRGRLEAGQSVLIQAGAGGVGHVAIQLAKLRQAKVCTTVSSQSKAEWVRRLGAERAIAYPQEDVLRAVLDWTDGLGVHLGFDTVGGPVLSATFSAVRYGGDVVTILAPDSSTNWKLARDRNLRLSFELMLTPQLENLVSARLHQTHILENCRHWIDQGLLDIHVAETFPLAEAATAHQRLEQGGFMGKLVLEIPERM